MSIYSLERVFNPKSVAVIAAGDRHDRLGASVLRSLIDGGFEGEIYPVHPDKKTLSGMASYQSVQQLPYPPDLAVIASPIRKAPAIVKALSTVSAGGAAILSAGDKAIGGSWSGVESAIRQAVEGSQLRVIGPGCLGIICSHLKLNACPVCRMPIIGKTAFISQSASVCSAVLDYSFKERIGFSYFVSLGSMLDVDFGDMIDYVGNDPSVGSVVMYIERLARVRNFMSAARAVSRVKPIIVLKAGRSRAGALAAAPYTGALAGEEAAYDAAFKRAGIVMVKTFEELFDCAELLDKQPRPLGSGLAVLSNAGGPAVMAVDALADYGFEPVRLSSDTMEKLDELLPGGWSRTNPVDIFGAAAPGDYQKAAEILLNAVEVNGLLIMWAPDPLSDPSAAARALTGKLSRRPLPILTCWIGGASVEGAREIFRRSGISTFNTLERAVRAFMDLYKYARHIDMLVEIPSALPKRLDFDDKAAGEIIRKGMERRNGRLTGVEARELLSAYGIAVNPAAAAEDEAEAVFHARQIGFPVAVKVFSDDVFHKGPAKGVMLNIENSDEVRRAFYQVIENTRLVHPEADIRGVTIEPMLSRPDYELMVGVRRDPNFGPLLIFGLGGLLTEVVKDQAMGLPPLNRLLARRMMEDTQIFKILKGYRDNPPVNIAAVEEILIRLSQLAIDFSEIEEIHVNPLMVDREKAVAADSSVRVSPGDIRAPFHLVVSPYPEQHESSLVLQSAGRIKIRPIRPEDAPLLEEFFGSLSARSIYYRFFRTIKKLPPHMLARFTQIDYDREIALVAVKEENEHELMLGVGRVIPDYDGRRAEFTIVVADAWHKKGIGAEILRRCLALARKQKISEVWGIVMADNINMLALGRKLGFSIKRMASEPSYELTLKFSDEDAETDRILKD